MVRDLVQSAVPGILTDISLKNVSLADFTLEETINPNRKNKKMDVPQCVEFLNHETCRFFSSRTVRNLRCFFVVDAEQTQCHYEQCKLARAAFVNSNSSCSFTCPHTVKAEEAVQPLSTHTLTHDVISQYKGDQSTKDRLIEVMNAVPQSVLSPKKSPNHT